MKLIIAIGVFSAFVFALAHRSEERRVAAMSRKFEDVMARFDIGEITTREALIQLRGILSEIKGSVSVATYS